MRLAGFEGQPQGLARAQQVRLSHDVLERSGPHDFRERRRRQSETATDGEDTLCEAMVKVRVDGQVSRDAVAIGGPARINGRVGGSVVSVGGSVHLGPGAVIEGDVSSVGGGYLLAVRIVAPTDGESFDPGQTVDLVGVVIDDKQPWRSDGDTYLAARSLAAWDIALKLVEDTLGRSEAQFVAAEFGRPHRNVAVSIRK